MADGQPPAARAPVRILGPWTTRAATLAMILRSLKPGGVLFMQEMELPEPAESARPAYALRKLVARGWEVPFARSAEALAGEATDVGFALVRLAQTDFGRMVIVQRPGGDAARPPS